MKNIVDKSLETTTAIIMVAMVFMCCWQIFTRYILDNASSVSEEFLRYALIWVSMLGTPYAYGKRKHIAIILLNRTFTDAGKRINEFFIEIVVIFLSISILLVGGTQVMLNSAGQVSPALGMPMQFLYLCLPVCGVLMLFYSACNIAELKKEEANL